MRKRLEEIAQVREKRKLNLSASTAPLQPEYEHVNMEFNKIIFNNWLFVFFRKRNYYAINVWFREKGIS